MLFIFSFGCTGSSLLCRGSLIAVSGGYSGCGAGGFSGCRAQALGFVGFRSCGAQAQLPHGMWDLSEPGVQLESPALAGRFFFFIFNFYFFPFIFISWRLITLQYCSGFCLH